MTSSSPERLAKSAIPRSSRCGSDFGNYTARTHPLSTRGLARANGLSRMTISLIWRAYGSFMDTYSPAGAYKRWLGSRR